MVVAWGNCQAGRSLCASSLTWRLRFQQEPFAHGKPVEPWWQPCVFRCYLGWTCLLSIWELLKKTQGVLIYVHARLQSCKLYLNKHAKDTWWFLDWRLQTRIEYIHIYILDEHLHPFGIKKKPKAKIIHRPRCWIRPGSVALAPTRIYALFGSPALLSSIIFFSCMEY